MCALADLLNDESRITLLCGSGCAGSHNQLLDLGEKLKGKEHVEWDSPYVVGITGLIGFTMLMGDFLSLAQLGLPVKVVVFHSNALGFVEPEQKSTGFVDFGTDLKNPNFAATAEAVGIRGIRLEDPAEVEPGIAAALAHDRPVLVDAAGAFDAAPYHSRNGERLHALHAQGGHERSRRRDSGSRGYQSLAMSSRGGKRTKVPPPKT